MSSEGKDQDQQPKLCQSCAAPLKPKTDSEAISAELEFRGRYPLFAKMSPAVKDAMRVEVCSSCLKKIQKMREENG